MKNEDFFPGIITDLPKADIPIEGLHSYLLQSEKQQIIFMSFDNDVEVREHSHAAQWGVVLDGEIELTIDSWKNVFTKGDTYFIPDDVLHSAKIKAGYKDLTLFNQRARYKTKD